MRKIVLTTIVLFCAILSFSQKKNKEKIDLSILKPNKSEWFDSSIFNSKTSSLDSFSQIIKREETTAKMPVFIANGNFKTRLFKIDTLKNYSLRIYKIK